MDADRNIWSDGAGVPRILEDLADGRMGAAEAEAVVTWLAAEGLKGPPPWVVNRAVRVAEHALATEAPRPPAPPARAVPGMWADPCARPGPARAAAAAAGGAAPRGRTAPRRRAPA